MDEQQIDSIAVNLLTPLLARLLGWASGVLLGGAGISLTVPGDAPGKIAIIVVGLVGMVIHQLMAKAATVSNAKSAYAQGSAAAGSPIAISDTPKVVSGSATVGSNIAPGNIVTPPAPTIETKTFPAASNPPDKI